MHRRTASLLVAGAWLLSACAPAPERGAWMTQLHDARLPRRIEPRLSIDVVHLPCEPVPAAAEFTVPAATCEGGTAKDLAARTRAARIQAGAKREAARAVDADAIQADAVVDLLYGEVDPAFVSRAVERLRSAARLAPSADVLADLAAAHLVRAGAVDDPDDLVAALDASLRALELDPAHEAARWNAALAEERMALDLSAREDWTAYLAEDRRSPWADEARRRRAALPSPRADTLDYARPDRAALEAFAVRAPQLAREAVFDSILPAWARHRQAGAAARAEPWLASAEILGAALLRRPGGDASAADATRAIRTALATGRTDDLEVAHTSYGDGRQALQQERRFTDARRHFGTADSAAARSPLLRGWARFGTGVSFYYDRQADSARTQFEALRDSADASRHPALAGRAILSLTTLASRAGHSDSAFAQATSAEPLFTRAGETENLGATHMLLSEAADKAGDPAASARHEFTAAHTLRTTQDLQWFHNLAYQATERADDAGLRHVALRFLDEDVARLREGPSWLLAEAAARHAIALARLGRSRPARESLALAERLLDSIPSLDTREYYRQDLREARVTLERNPCSRSVALTDSMVTYFDSTESIPRLLDALFLRAELHRARSDPDLEQADLDSAMNVLASRRDRTDDVSAAGRPAAERLALLHAHAGNARESRDALERARVSLRASVGRERRAPTGTAIVSLLSSDDELIAWTTVGDRVTMRMDTVPADELARLVEQATVGLENGVERAGARDALERLHALLVPLIGPVPPKSELVIVTDGVLARVPFAALLDPRDGRFLIENFSIRYAASIADASLARSVRPPSEKQRLVAIAPSFDRIRHGLPLLPNAESEVGIIARHYPQPITLIGLEATPTNVRETLKTAGIVHFAGHAVLDETRTARSHLVLARDPDGSDVLTMGEMERLDLRGVRLVVLAACRTQRGDAERMDGISGFTRAAMRAGADGVIGSLWQVDDRKTFLLMTAFHSAYRESGDPSAALRDAQITFLRQTDGTLRSPAAWAGFRYAGI